MGGQNVMQSMKSIFLGKDLQSSIKFKNFPHLFFRDKFKYSKDFSIQRFQASSGSSVAGDYIKKGKSFILLWATYRGVDYFAEGVAL